MAESSFDLKLRILTCGGFCFSADTVPFVLPFRSFSADIVPFLYRSVHFKSVPLPVFEGTVQERYRNGTGTVQEWYRNGTGTVQCRSNTGPFDKRNGN